MSGALTVRLPGKVDRILQDGNYPADEPAIWARYRQGQRTCRSGNGYSVWATLSRPDWRDVADYLQSVVDCLADMQVSERGEDGEMELRAGRIALSRIGKACGRGDDNGVPSDG